MSEFPPGARAKGGRAAAAQRKLNREQAAELELKEMDKNIYGRVLARIANGMRRADAAKDVGITMVTLRFWMANEPGALEQMRSAETTWLRRDWPLERIEEVLIEVAIGKTLKEAMGELDLLDEEKEQLHRLLVSDPEYKDMYKEARKMQAVAWADEIVEISKDDSNDMAQDARGGDKPNTAAVARHKLITDNLRWVMARTHHDQWGDRIQQDINGNLDVNLTELLDGARKRAESAARAKAERDEGIPVPPTSPTEEHVTH